ncbi:ubiquitin carboxyl-terminal hydrolase MINDY-2-like isoform X1 [Saccostrea echinata]|uniref:ubiquitin carboxyl-terminal hydrolase MINDY-2-like isoform X1 n=1 Tax=Saccostrea echinata TaxID=191078 RepID=UPI002A8136BE|nr:ubiquitin carboxyl-terminal hydrolase MINDY-2-like isoform X1 [Saccostrea echinata]
MTTPSKEGNDPCSNEKSEDSESDPDVDEVLLAEFEENEATTERKQVEEVGKPQIAFVEEKSDMENSQPEPKKCKENEPEEKEGETWEPPCREKSELSTTTTTTTDSYESSDTSQTSGEQTKLRVELPALASVNDAAIGATATPVDNSCEPSVYHVKWTSFNSLEVPIITQNENGPCPLLAVMNILLLKAKVRLDPGIEVITPEQIMTYLGDSILLSAPTNGTEAVQLNFQQNMHDAMAVIHKLQTGLDVNVRFTGIQDFEYTPECIIFDLLGIPLYHGWLVDPQDMKMVEAIGNCSYNQLVEKIISDRSSEREDLVNQALLAEAFLDRTASQLTYHGLYELNSTVKEDQLCVFFRNNHFSTLYKQKNELFLLVTDQGFLNEKNVVWETLNNVEGDGYFVDAQFHTYTKPPPLTETLVPPEVPPGSDEQVDQDYLLAMSLQQEQQMTDEELAWKQNQQQHQQVQMSDHELAAKLQAEEDEQAMRAINEQQQRQQQQQQQQPQGQRSTAQGARGRPQERERESEREPRDRSKDNRNSSLCCIL